MAAQPSLTIEPFQLAGASDAEYTALSRHVNRARAETLPDDPPTPATQLQAELQNIPAFVAVFVWAAWEHGEIVGSAEISFTRTEENAYLVEFSITVGAERRRRGLGRALLRQAVDVPRAEGRRLMMTATNGCVPAGSAFMQRLGAERAQEMHTNQLVLADLDAALLARWQAEGPQRAAGFTLGGWDGPYPDDQLAAMVTLTEAMNAAPRDGLDREDEHFTAEHLRQIEQMMAAGWTERWTLYAREKATGRVAGLTEVHWNPNRPDVVTQGFTGVLREFQGRGLGRWLKAAMLDRIRRDRPGAKFVGTGNADSNAAMLGINHALGFTPYTARTLWQVETEKVLASVGRRGEPPLGLRATAPGPALTAGTGREYNPHTCHKHAFPGEAPRPPIMGEPEREPERNEPEPNE